MTDLRRALPAGVTRRSVLLRHELPDGSHHFDWMIASDESGEGPLLTFRLACPIFDLDESREHVLERLADHRPVYLDHEGPISRDRGRVRRIAKAEIECVRLDPPGRITLLTRWFPQDGDSSKPLQRRISLESLENSRWRLLFTGKIAAEPTQY